MSFAVESENLRTQAKLWSGRAADCVTVQNDCASAIGQGRAFGFMAGANGVTRMYDRWTADINNCLSDAAYSFRYLDAALVSTANEYDDSDATAAESAAALDKKLEQKGYSHG